jgi:beta-glucanase (GH16 family)
MRYISTLSKTTLISAVLLALSGCQNDDPAEGGELANPPPPTSAPFSLVFADEFDGTSLDLSRWEIQTGDGTSEGLPPGWGNNELQFYTEDNIIVEDGFLVIEARVGDSPDPNFNFTSGRIRTQGLFDFTYGRVEARIQVPEGLGLWAAFWMLGSDPSPFGAWAARGEIDILESFGQETQFAQGTAHFGMVFPLNENVSRVNNDVDPTDGFHQYAVEWDSERIRWFIDGDHYFTVSKETYWNYFYQDREVGFISGADDAPFSADQHILLNMAVGGDPAGTPNPNDTDVFPGRMLVDYVRVYECPFAPVDDGLGCENTIDQVDPFIITQGGDGTPPPQDVAIASFTLFDDATGTLFEGTNSARPIGIGVFDNNGALTIAEVAADDATRGNVIDVVTTGGGNIQINDPTGDTFNLFGMGRADNNEFFGGELEFDVLVIGAETDGSAALQVSMDSGFPNTGFIQIPLSELPTDEWTTLSLSISEVIQSNIGAFGGQPLNIEEVLNLIVFEPTGAAHMQFDNVRLLCGAPESRRCGIVSVPTVPQNVFIDSTDPVWDFGIAGADSGSGFAGYTDGTNPDGVNKIQWEEVADEDPARDQVIDVTFNDSEEFGVFFVQSTSPVDLSGFANGAVVFDLLVTDYGNNTDGMTMRIDCIFPCTSGDQALGVVADGVWETIEIPLSQLIAGGLNTSMVNSGLVLFPTSQSGDINFRLDNVRWEPRTTVVTGPAPAISFSTDFESSDPAAGALGDNWMSFGTAFDADGNFAYNYGAPFGTPNNGGGFAAIVGGQGGDAQGNQQVSLFSDYNNQDHGNGFTIDVVTFQQFDVTENDTGTYRLTFDVRAPDEFAIAPPSTASAFIQTLDPNNGFITTTNVNIDLSGITSTEWVTMTLDLAIDGNALNGQILQFGFSNQATDFDPTALLFDNINFNLATGGISFNADFESSDATATSIGDGWTSFATAFNADGGFAYNYGTFDTPSNTGGFAGIGSGEGEEAQGLQYLNIFSDYNNADHGNGLTIEALSFQERVITAADGGNYRLTFDAKAPFEGGIAPPTTAFAFLRTIDPNSGFATTNDIRLDMSGVSSTDWATFTVELTIDAALLEGQLLQFGFANAATAFNPSGIFYDNITLGTVE